ncbi:hypothetical protein CH63R_10213 [Colletotrichum higginsianum IMI 349063]|uniref:Uncharacterized protein n=1 Tax=Colletotrichum higginsianum (strain IMI 349063) TaxID=759273 RepID=A0A1B7Y248_COLHI|nr:uncharacterized protein CH63R_10213 [Colletotrichum higginsianum IMI 349063]OBR06093.1 hypothetical protein CH63R_10213 [Colletotrichum higginsianum IMI 349063]
MTDGNMLQPSNLPTAWVPVDGSRFPVSSKTARCVCRVGASAAATPPVGTAGRRTSATAVPGGSGLVTNVPACVRRQSSVASPRQLSVGGTKFGLCPSAATFRHLGRNFLHGGRRLLPCVAQADVELPKQGSRTPITIRDKPAGAPHVAVRR